MKTIKINRNNITSVLSEIKLDCIQKTEEGTIVKVATGHKHNMVVGDYIVFKSYIRKNDTFTDSSYAYSVVTNIIDSETFMINSLSVGRYKVNAVEPLNDGWYLVTLDRPHKVQATNIEEYKEFQCTDKKSIITFYDDSRGIIVESDDVVSSYGYVDRDKSLFDYGIIIDKNLTDDMIFVKNIGDVYDGMYVEFPFDSIFYYDNSGFALMWNTSVAYKDMSYYNVPVGFASDDEWRNMYQDVIVNDIYVNDMISKLSSDPIDMEKIKYVPYFSGDTLVKITGLTINFHFRNRQMKLKAENGMTKKDNEKNLIYDDGWYTTDEIEGWNNGITQPTMYSDEDKLNKSDLVSYLDFTDNDIENQKKKVGKSFVRLSFYDDIDPVEQRLLYYSTGPKRKSVHRAAEFSDLGARRAPRRRVGVHRPKAVAGRIRFASPNQILPTMLMLGHDSPLFAQSSTTEHFPKPSTVAEAMNPDRRSRWFYVEIDDVPLLADDKL